MVESPGIRNGVPGAVRAPEAAVAPVRDHLDPPGCATVDRRLRDASLGRFKAMADFQWTRLVRGLPNSPCSIDPVLTLYPAGAADLVR